MNRTFTILASAAITALSLVAGHATDAPLPPRASFLAIPASRVLLGMTADDVTEVMGNAVRRSDFAIGAAQTSKLEFAGTIPGQVVLSDGRVSRVTLDPFRVKQATLPSFIRQARPGFASSAVRRAVGEPSVVLHHTFFGIEVDQWIFSRAGDIEASVFFRADRVIAVASGRNVPADLFRVDLPSPPDAESEGSMLAPRLGMTICEIEKLYDAPLYRVDYVVNGQSASRRVYEIGKTGTFNAVTLVDGVATELEDLGRMPRDPSFQGR